MVNWDIELVVWFKVSPTEDLMKEKTKRLIPVLRGFQINREASVSFDVIAVSLRNFLPSSYRATKRWLCPSWTNAIQRLLCLGREETSTSTPQELCHCQDWSLSQQRTSHDRRQISLERPWSEIDTNKTSEKFSISLMGLWPQKNNQMRSCVQFYVS